MALPQHKTCLSVLRSILGPISGGEKRFADLIGRSRSWLKKASCGQIPLTEDVAFRISFETGVSEKWLTDGDPTVQPTTGEGKPFTKDTFSATRTNIEQWGNAPEEVEEAFLDWFVSFQAKGLRSVAKSANANGKLPLFFNAVANALSELADKFGQSSDGENRFNDFSKECNKRFNDAVESHPDDPITLKRARLVVKTMEIHSAWVGTKISEIDEKYALMLRQFDKLDEDLKGFIEGKTVKLPELPEFLEEPKPVSLYIKPKQKLHPIKPPQTAKPSRQPRKKK